MTTAPGPGSEQAWLEQVRALLLRGDSAAGAEAVALALRDFPQSFELRRILAGIQQRGGREAEAETLFQQLLAERSDDAGTAFALARMLVNQCRSAAAAAVIRRCFGPAARNPELAIQAIELLDDCERKRDAAAIATQAIECNPNDPRLHAYAGMLWAQLGEFPRARTSYLYALEHAPAACEWHVPYGLASLQRYRDAAHPDFARFQACLDRKDLTDKARSTLLFALAKAYADIGAVEPAATYSRQANRLAHTLTRWSRKQWRRAIETRLRTAPTSSTLLPAAGFAPIFIVGVPRAGTTLVAELLARSDRVCNRGESPWLARLAQRPELAGNPDRSALQQAANTYMRQLQQDDSRDSHWFIDKQPLNFRYVDLALALFPDARIVYCQRNARDHALSLWLQAFLEDVQGYAYDFQDIACVMHDCERLMARWQSRYPDSIHAVRYEELAAAPARVMASLTAWLGLPAPDADAAAHGTPTSISTASLWQARQPVYTTSLGRWKAYATQLPELLQFADDASAAGGGKQQVGGEDEFLS